MRPDKNCLVILGPTASGKTCLGVELARLLRGEILSADSRQVYRGLDLASGKDREEYRTANGTSIPVHLIDRVSLEEEYDLFHYLRDFQEAFAGVVDRGNLPVVVGGTGLFLDAVVFKYRMVEAALSALLREELSGQSDEELREHLQALRPHLHNRTDLEDRDRMLRAIEIAEAEQSRSAEESEQGPGPEIHPLILGMEWPVEVLNNRIEIRLRDRFRRGMIEEIQELHNDGVPWDRLESLGLECRFIGQFLQGKIRNQNDLFQKLLAAIRQFAKRQRTWFRRMERKGAEIHWIPGGRPELAVECLRNQAPGLLRQYPPR